MRRPAESRRKASRRARKAKGRNDLPAVLYLLAAVVVAGLIAAFAIWMDEKNMLALVSCGAFAGLLVWWGRGVWCGWRDAEPVERIIGVLGCVLLLGASAANLVRFLYRG